MAGPIRSDAGTVAGLLRDGGLAACPTEAVWGVSCDPFDEAAVLRLLRLKQRPVDKGLILVADTVARFDGLLDWAALPDERAAAVRASWPGPHTWIVPATARVPRWITGTHAGVAVRVTAHPSMAALCEAFGGPLVSTSANPAGAPPPRRPEDFDPALRDGVDAVLAGDTGAQARPTEIRDARTGEVLRL
jgi:L-threonylcarbamoyladenylate synthase